MDALAPEVEIPSTEIDRQSAAGTEKLSIDPANPDAAMAAVRREVFTLYNGFEILVFLL